MKVSPNLRGPSRKAKYSLVTDSEPSSASERWEEPRQGEDSEPETTCLQAVRAHLVNLPPSVPGLQIADLRLQIEYHSLEFQFAIRNLKFAILRTFGGGLTRSDGVPFA